MSHSNRPILRAATVGLALLAAVLLAVLLAVPPARAQPAAAGKVVVQWLGQAAFKITSPTGKVIVIGDAAQAGRQRRVLGCVERD